MGSLALRPLMPQFKAIAPPQSRSAMVCRILKLIPGYLQPMQYYKLEITINKDGTITEKVLASGIECTAVTEELEKALGEVVSQRLLPEAQNIEVENETIAISGL